MITTTGSDRRYSFYLPELSLMAETQTTSAATPTFAYEYVWFAGQPLAQIETATGAISWYLNDHLGTPTLQTDASAQVVWRAEYEPYGSVFAFRTGAGRHQPLRFPGQESDGMSESFNIFRWYRARWGRYTQADPIGMLAGVNLYGYVEGNPTNWSDPQGLISRRELDEMDCCQLVKAIQDARKELLRLRKNQNNPAKRKARNAAEYAANYVGHRTSWWSWQNRLRDLLREFDRDNCDPQMLPREVRKLQDDRYPDFPWDEFMEQYREGMNQTMRDINEWMNDPRNWLSLIAASRGGGRRIMAGAHP